jgi:Cd2+/Zn2+-exporting ATPase
MKSSPAPSTGCGAGNPRHGAASDSTLARIIHAVEQAQSSRAPTQRFVDRFAAIYTPAVFVLAVAVALLAPWLMGLTWMQAAYKALVLLVIACPCAW